MCIRDRITTYYERKTPANPHPTTTNTNPHSLSNPFEISKTHLDHLSHADYSMTPAHPQHAHQNPLQRSPLVGPKITILYTFSQWFHVLKSAATEFGLGLKPTRQ